MNERALLKLLKQSKGRFLVAYDGYWHLRATLCVTHDEERGEAVYATKPIASADSLEGIRAELEHVTGLSAQFLEHDE
jgi:hypothetical protein